MIRAAFSSPLRTVLTTAVLFRIATGWLLSTRPSDLNVGDPGQWIDAGDRILRGEWPYRDWTGIYGPLLYAWGAFWYGLLGADWRAALQMLEIVSPVACLLLAAATAKLMLPTERWQAGFLLAVAVLGLDAFYWSPGIRIWLPVAALAWAANPPTGRWSWLPFAVCGLTPILSPDTGLPCIIASLLLFISSGLRTARVKFVTLLMPTCLLWFAWPFPTVQWMMRTVDLASLASWIWGTPFPGDQFPFRRLTFLLPLIFAMLVSLRMLWTYRRATSAGRIHLLPDLALWLLAAACLRSLLGRTDTAHLLFILPPLLLLAFRSAVRWPVPGAAAAAVAFTLPFLWLSVLEGPARRALDAWRHPAAEVGAVSGERISLPARFARHLARVTAAANPLLAPGEPVLSLPVPLYAHLLRRAQHLSHAVPELLHVGWMTTEREWIPPRVVIVDPELALPWDSYFLAPPGGPLTWSTPADEPITRDLREHLRRWYVVKKDVEGARILLRRAAPLPARRERIVRSLEPAPGDPDAVMRGETISLSAHGAVCEEVRTMVRFTYPPGLAGLAKSYTRVTAVTRAGRMIEMVQPLPPAHLGIELRWPVPRVPLDRVMLEAGNPGTFNPDPVSASVAPVRLIGYAD